MDSREAVPGALFAALPGERVDGATSPPSRPRRARSRCSPTARSLTCATCRDRDRRCDRRPRRARPGGAAPAAVGDRHRDHRVVGQDLDQGPHRPGGRPAGPHHRPRRVLQQRARPAADVLRADESTRYLVLEMSARGIGHIAQLCDIAPPRIGAVLNAAAPTPGSSARSTPSPRPRASWSRRCRPTGSRSSTPTTPTWPRWPPAPGADQPVQRVRGPHGRPDGRRARRAISLDDRGRASFRMIAAGGGADAHCDARRPPRRQRAGRRRDRGRARPGRPRHRRRAEPRHRAQQEADGAARAGRRRARGERRLQRQPGLTGPRSRRCATSPAPAGAGSPSRLHGRAGRVRRGEPPRGGGWLPWPGWPG